MIQNEKQIQEIIERNKLISIFMELNIGWLFHESQIEPLNIMKDACTKYHSDWNWLMRVVDKIESLEELDRNIKSRKSVCTPYRVEMMGRNVVEIVAFGEDSISMVNKDSLTKMQAVHRAVSGFILWYNTIKNTTA